MSWEVGIGLLGTTASLVGLAWDRKVVRKIALVFLALLAATLLIKGILYQRSISRLQAQMMDALVPPTMMSADQLYEHMATREVTRSLFDDALSQAVDARRLAHRMLELRTPDNVYVRVRVYSIP